jgi:exonuclease VII small subunit
MSVDLEKRLDAVCESLEEQKHEFEEGAKICVEAMYGMHQRLERIEKWMKEREESPK